MLSFGEYIDNVKVRFNERTLNVMRNVFLSIAMKAFSMLCSLLIVPVTLHYLNVENYGIWMAMTSILYWFAFMDVGLGNGMRNYLSEAISVGDYEKARSYFSTAIILIAGIAIVIGIIAVPFVYMLDLNSLFNTKGVDGNMLANVLMIAISFSLLQFVVKNIGLVYVAMQKYAVNDLIVFLGSLFSLITVYILTKTTEGSLLYIVTAFTSIPVLMFVLASFFLFRKHPEFVLTLSAIDLGIARKIVVKGLGFFFIQITSCLVIFGSANLFISHYCGPEQATVYNISFKLFNLLIVIYTIIISPLWNAYTDAMAKGDYEWIRHSFRRSLQMWMLTVVGGVILLFLSPYFFRLWVGESVDIPMDVSACVLAYVCMFNLNNCVTYLINGLNKIFVQVISSICVTFLFVLSILTFRGNYGIIGIVIPMFISYMIMSLVHLYQCLLIVNKRARGIWNR